ncbi:flagellar hook-associated protein FlgL [endosymbiont of Acanthamoeba sp. UWC8]|uniref:hypothetical protein n=1 Tax=endosymbiont of Acanthamoeba sp. UWC8 TaxID=86106 RepID=UPI0004D193DE|nr:hypothetical protein [endosymbiont of Acanthamoeba sp. UWC8]AIF81288.1 flagellar hook-associated protein FlgL [endosymbiont of Acanthamoeba sp. UWC8]
MTTIATFTSHKQMIKNVSENYASVNKSSNKISADKQYESFHEMAPNDLRLSEDLTNQVELTANRITNNKLLTSKLNEYENTVQTIQQVTEDAMRFVQVAKDSSNDNTLAIKDISTNYINEVKRLLSSNFNGEYLFSGSKTNISPISHIESISNVLPDGTITSNYYLGDNVTSAQKVSSTQDLDYAITADNESFQKLFAAFHYAAKYEESKDKADLVKSFNLMDEAQKGLNEMVAVLGSNGETVERIIQNDEVAIIDQQAALTSITSVNPELEYPKLIMKIGKLQASFMVVARASEMFIGDYIR